VADALLRRYALLLVLVYKKDENFNEVMEDPSTPYSFTLQDGFLFKRNKLCIPRSPPRDLVSRRPMRSLS